MVDGHWLMRDGIVRTMDEEAIVREADRIGRAAWRRLFEECPDLQPPPGLNWAIRGSCASCVGVPMAFRDLFTLRAAHCLYPSHALPGSHAMPAPCGRSTTLALAEAEIFARYPIDGLIVENFRDVPFYPHALPAESIAALTAVTGRLCGSTGPRGRKRLAQRRPGRPWPSPRPPRLISSASTCIWARWCQIRGSSKEPAMLPSDCGLPCAHAC